MLRKKNSRRHTFCFPEPIEVFEKTCHFSSGRKATMSYGCGYRWQVQYSKISNLGRYDRKELVRERQGKDVRKEDGDREVFTSKFLNMDKKEGLNQKEPEYPVAWAEGSGIRHRFGRRNDSGVIFWGSLYQSIKAPEVMRLSQIYTWLTLLAFTFPSAWLLFL